MGKRCVVEPNHPDPILAWMLRIFSAAVMLFLVSAIVPVGFFIAMRALQDYYGDQPVIVRGRRAS